MTFHALLDFIDRRPFVGFDMYLTDGRCVTISHPEAAVVGTLVAAVYFVHPDYTLEVIGTDAIVSCRSHQPLPGF